MAFELTNIESNLQHGLESNYELISHVGLLSKTDRAEVERLLGVADTALRFPAVHASQRNVRLAEAAERAIQASDAGQALTVEADQLATETVDQLAKLTWLAAIKAGRRIAFARVNEVPPVISREFELLTESATVLAGELVGVYDAEGAIRAGKVEEWTELADLRNTYSSLTAWVTELRRAHLIPAPIPSDGGAHWNFRLVPNKDGYRQAQARGDAGDGGRAMFLYDIGREPYVPASRDEAREVFKSWQEQYAA